MLQFNIVCGILIAFVSNALLAGIAEDAWRWMLGVAAFPSLLYALLCFGLPESPRWLLGRKGDRAGGLEVLQRIQPNASKAEIEAEADEIMAASSEKASSSHFWTLRLRKPILLAVLIAFFNQLSGINAILYFAPRIFELTGLGAKAALLNPSASASLISCSLLSASGSLTGWVVARFFLLDLSATSLRSVWLHGLFLQSTTASCRFVSSPSSRRTRSVRERLSGFLSPRYFPTVIARKVRRSAASRTGSSPPCLRLSFRRWSRPFRLATSFRSSLA